MRFLTILGLLGAVVFALGMVIESTTIQGEGMSLPSPISTIFGPFPLLMALFALGAGAAVVVVAIKR